MNGYYRKLEILKNYNNLCKHIDDLACDYGELLTKATRTAQVLRDDVGSSGHDNHSKVESFSVLLEEKKKRLEKAIEKRNRIDKALKKLGPRGEYLIRSVDINGSRLTKVSRDLKYDYIYATKLRKKLIEKLGI
jgi:hypothetical protein